MDEITIIFTEDVEIEVVETIDDDDNVDSYNEIFKKGQEMELDLISENPENYHVQFEDGSIAFIPKDVVDVMLDPDGDKEAQAYKDDKNIFDKDMTN